MANPVALITGGAGGIGLETARKLIGQGITVVISGRRQDVGDAAVQDLQDRAVNGAQARFIRNDVTDEAAAEAMIARIVAEFGCLNMAVNNAGISNETSTIEGSQTDSFQSLLSDTRHQLALEHLRDPGLEVAEIAYILGYDDQGSFYRAFQKWEGRPPAAWRANSR